MRPRNSRERGATTVIVALFLSTVMLGMLALTADVGNVVYERRQLQNGADAAALSLAQSCAEGDCALDAAESTALESLASLNAADGEHAIEQICGANVGGVLPGCPTSSYEWANCPPLPPSYASATTLPYVEVRTSTQRDGASTLWTPFHQAAGGDGTRSAGACSRAAWGAPSGAAATTPITISICEWDTYTSSGATWVVNPPVGAWPGYGGAGQPGYPPAATDPNTPGHELVIMLHDPSKGELCAYKGKDTAGGFGYLQPGDSCATEVVTTATNDQWANIDTGSSATLSCQDLLAQIWANGPVIDIPVFDCIIRSGTEPTGGITGLTCDGSAGGGAKTWYHIKGWAKFYLSGYKIGGGPEVTRYSRVTGSPPCTGSERCLSGWFVKGVLGKATGIIPPGGGGEDLGSYAVIPLG